MNEILENYKIFCNYDKNRNNDNFNNEYNLTDEELQSFKRSITVTAPEIIGSLIQNPNFQYNGSYGRNNPMADCPHIDIQDQEFSEFEGEKFFLAYIFEKDCSYFYLSLCFEVGESRNAARRDLLRETSNNFRELLKNHINSDDLLESMDLNSTNEYPKCYENANIFAKRYDKDNLPSPEEFIADLRFFLDLYEISKDVYFHKFLLDDYTTSSNEINSSILFNRFLGFKGIFFNQETIENYLLSLKVKPFIILTGNSGTGKTRLSQLFAEYLSNKIGGNNRIIPVGANWTDNRNVFGYYNVISKRYQSTPALSLINEASEENNKEKPYFLILDEMNLSHVERYFSDFLSSIESKKPIPLHNRQINNVNNGDIEGSNENNADNGNNNNSEIKDENNNTIKSDLIIPPNLFVVGTVNVDETTYMFSPKVLDRANVLEFETFSPSTITIDGFFNNSFGENNFENVSFNQINYLENPLSDLGILDNPMSFFKEELNSVKIIKSNDKKEEEVAEHMGEEPTEPTEEEVGGAEPVGDEETDDYSSDDGIESDVVAEDNNTVQITYSDEYLWGALSHQLTCLHNILKKSGFDFGFRVVKEVTAFMYVSWKYENRPDEFVNWDRYFDAQIKQKILPKIHGSKKVLGDTLDELLAFCIGCEVVALDDKLINLESNENSEKYEFSPTNTKYPNSAMKIAEMREVLEKQRYVSFIN